MEIDFKTGPGGALVCDFIKGSMDFVKVVFTPKLLLGEQVTDKEIIKFSVL